MLLEGLREQVVQVGLDALAAGIVHGTAGNMSIRDPESGLIAISPSGIPYPDVTPADVVIVTWNSTKLDSLKFFADRGNPQILSGCYDGTDLSGVPAWLDAAATVKGIRGVMYTTWTSDYTKLEEWMKLVQAFEASARP